MRKLIGIGMFAVLGGAAIAFAQTDHSRLAAMMDHAAQDPTGLPADAVLTEPGQGAFAALSEVVRYLEADQETDWSRVDLSSLRAHLVDMDRLVSEAEVKDERPPNGIL